MSTSWIESIQEMSIQQIIDEIKDIQSEPTGDWLDAIYNQEKVDMLHKQLDFTNYCGERPPKNWSHLTIGH